jgi:hypothetical protein
LEFTRKISRLILELSKFRVQNFMKVVSLETLHHLNSEVLSQEFFKWSFKSGFYLPRDSNNFSLGYIFSDFEKESADLAFIAVNTLKGFLKYITVENTDIVDLLKRMKSLDVKNQN